MKDNKNKVVNELLKRISNLEFDVEDKQREIERLNKNIQATKNNILKDISMIKIHRDMSKEEIITRLKSTLIILDRK